MSHAPDPLRAAAGGILAGLIAGAVMNAFQSAWSAASGSGGSDEEPTTTKAADKAARALTGEPLPEPLRKPADPIVHYGLSALLGLGYGLAAETLAPVRAGFGTGFGLGTALLLDEAAVPALGLSPPPDETPLSTHVYGLASHLVFGVALEAARRALGGRA